MNILGTLGLDSVTADPNEVPVGTYDADITESSIVLSKNKDTVAHVITFKVVGGDEDGKTPTQWNTLGSEPRDAEGNFPSSANAIEQYKNTMSKKQKEYYKKTWVDSGFPEDQVGKLPVEALVGSHVTIRCYVSNGYKNIAVNGVRHVDNENGPTEGPSNTEGATPFHSF